MIDRAFGVFLLCLGLYVLYGGLSLEVPFSYDPLGPSAFPIALGAVLALLSLFVIVKPGKAHFPGRTTELKTVLIVVLLFAYQLSFNILGFLLSTGLLVFCISKIFKGTTVQALGSGVGVSVVVYLIFSFLLEVPLPVGSLFAKLLGA
jgi:putative tricarboxylic transport membrane protein